MIIRTSLLILALCMLFPVAYAENNTSKINVQLEEFAAISINKTITNIYRPPDEIVYYLIRVRNEGEIELQNVKVVDLLPQGMKYVDSAYNNSNAKFLLRCIEIGENEETKSVTWMLGSLETGQEKEIVLTVSKTNMNNSEMGFKIYAEGKALNNYINDTQIGNSAQ